MGHVQRGGSPSLRDRVAASRMGYHAVELLLSGSYDRVVAERGLDIIDYDITEALTMNKGMDPELVKIAQIISI